MTDGEDEDDEDERRMQRARVMPSPPKSCESWVSCLQVVNPTTVCACWPCIMNGSRFPSPSPSSLLVHMRSVVSICVRVPNGSQMELVGSPVHLAVGHSAVSLAHGRQRFESSREEEWYIARLPCWCSSRSLVKLACVCGGPGGAIHVFRYTGKSLNPKVCVCQGPPHVVLGLGGSVASAPRAVPLPCLPSHLSCPHFVCPFLYLPYPQVAFEQVITEVPYAMAFCPGVAGGQGCGLVVGVGDALRLYTFHTRRPQVACELKVSLFCAPTFVCRAPSCPQ